jgi:hypothetical protein
MTHEKKQTIINRLVAAGFSLKQTGKFDSVRARFCFAIDEVVLIVFTGTISSGVINFEVRIPDSAPTEIITANIDAIADYARRNTTRPTEYGQAS